MSSSRSADASSDPVPVTSLWHSRALAAGLCQAAADEIPSLSSLPSTLLSLSPFPLPSSNPGEPASCWNPKENPKETLLPSESLTVLPWEYTNCPNPTESASHSKIAAGCAVWYLFQGVQE